jgi:hypothetical protein
MVTSRNEERRKIASAGLTLKWFEPIPLLKAKELKLSNYEPFTM